MEGKQLVIVESPAKAQTIQKFLGKDYIVKPSFGHIRDLQENSLSVDVDHNFKPEYVIPSDKKKIVSELKKLAKDASTVWLASDEDREGEAISWHLYETLDLSKADTKRIVFHEITKNAIENAVQNPRSIDMKLVDAQQARRVLDRLVGFELSPVLWRKIQPKLSAGRVQSVALRLIVDKEREVTSFKSEPFYRVEAVFHPQGAAAPVKVKATLEKHFKNVEDARKFLLDSVGATFSISSIDKKEASRTPAPPFTTSTLQQEASRKLHFSVSMTMRIAQQLYERGLITYMRTDSTNLSSLALGSAKKFIYENYGEQYSKTRQYHTHSKGAQEAHEAIRPTFIDNTDIQGTAQEKKLYNLIWKRTVASQMADAKVMRTDIRISSDKRSEKFAVTATEVLFDGFLKVYMESSDDQPEGEDVILPKMEVGGIMQKKSMGAECKYTAPPSRYSEATLVKKLEELGIGRPSTYAPTISTLTTGRGYVVKGDKEGTKIPVTNLVLNADRVDEVSKTEVVGAEKSKLLPQDIGMIVTDYLVKNFTDVLDYDFTANVEKDFDQIADGEKRWTDVIASFYSPFHKKIDEVMKNGEYSHVSRSLGVDPSDGLEVVARFGQYGPYVQKGDGENKQTARLGAGQLIESITLKDALSLFQLPRTVGKYKDVDVVVTKGKYGPYIKYGKDNFSLPKNTDPMKVSLETCIAEIEKKLSDTGPEILAEYESIDVKIINGKFGPYIKHAGGNYRIPRDTDVASLTEEDCKKLIETSEPTKHRSFKKKRSKS